MRMLAWQAGPNVGICPLRKHCRHGDQYDLDSTALHCNHPHSRYGIGGASRARAGVTYPAPPQEYDVQLRFRIRAPLPAWYDRFDEMLAGLKKIGFVRGPVVADAPEDPSNDVLSGTVASEKVRLLLQVPGVQTILVKPKGSPVPRPMNEQRFGWNWFRGFLPSVSCDCAANVFRGCGRSVFANQSAMTSADFAGSWAQSKRET